MKWNPRGFCLLAAMLTAACGCQTAYYKTMETFGVHKRDILVDRVEDARDAQEDAKEQFQTALEAFSALTGFHGGELQETYERLQAELDRSEARAEAVHRHVDGVQQVADDLFAEWERELGQYEDARLRRASEDRLRDTQRRYDDLMQALRRAESRIEPVLGPLRDHVLFLKHNLNANAIASLEMERVEVEEDVAALVRDMELAIDEAQTFIAEMRSANE